MKYLLIALTMILSLGTISSQKPRDEKMSSKIEAQKIAFITQALDLTPEEAEKFWPLYNEYNAKRKELRPDSKERKKVKGISEEEANEVIDFFFENEQKRLNLQKNYYKRFQAAIPSSKVVKLHFAERRFKQKLLTKIKRKREKRRR